MTTAPRAAPGAAFGRPQAGLVAVLLALAALAWWETGQRMGDMPTAAGAGFGGVGFYAGLWVVMMAAMMFPSIAPMVVVYDRLRASRRSRGARSPGMEGSALFVAGYLVTWTASGLLAYALLQAAHALAGDVLAWDRAGREVVAGVVLASAAYQLSPLKDRCLAHCRGPLMFLLEHWREGRLGAARMGISHGAWCVGCCWALMATLFALGLMSLGWMALVAVLIAGEKLLPRRARAPRAVAVLLLGIGLAVLVAPDLVPGVGPAREEGMRM